MAIIPVFQKILSKFQTMTALETMIVCLVEDLVCFIFIFIMLVTIHTTNDASSEVSRKS